MDKKIFEDLSGAEGTTLRQLIIKYRDEMVPEYKSARTLTYKLNHMLKFKICYSLTLHTLISINTNRDGFFIYPASGFGVVC